MYTIAEGMRRDFEIGRFGVPVIQSAQMRIVYLDQNKWIELAGLPPKTIPQSTFVWPWPSGATSPPTHLFEVPLGWSAIRPA